MSGILTESLAEWRRAHGFGLIALATLRGECFLVETRPSEEPGDFRGWTTMTEEEAARYLRGRGFSAAETDSAIALARDWATTVTGSALLGSIWPGTA